MLETIGNLIELLVSVLTLMISPRFLNVEPVRTGNLDSMMHTPMNKASADGQQPKSGEHTKESHMSHNQRLMQNQQLEHQTSSKGNSSAKKPKRELWKLRQIGHNLMYSKEAAQVQMVPLLVEGIFLKPETQEGLTKKIGTGGPSKMQGTTQRIQTTGPNLTLAES